MGTFHSKYKLAKDISDKELIYEGPTIIRHNNYKTILEPYDSNYLNKSYDDHCDDYIVKINSELRFVIYDVIYKETIDYRYKDFYIKILTNLNIDDIEIIHINKNDNQNFFDIFDFENKTINLNLLNENLTMSKKIIELLKITNNKIIFPLKKNNDCHITTRNYMLLFVFIIIILLFVSFIK